VDLLDADSVARAIGTVRQASGHVDVLVHAAGIEASRSLANKSQQEFDAVFDVKATGFYHLLHAIGEMPLRASVVFSSVAARFGNAGQTDYSAANDFLCKASTGFRSTRPGTRGVAIDWTAWRDIGMAARGSFPLLLQQAGIELLPPDMGIPVVRQHLAEGWAPGEVVVAGRLGLMTAEADVTGGLDLEAVAARGASSSGPMLGRVVSMTVHDGLVIETTLDPADQPFLSDHRIDGVPVLPGAMGVEAFAELASLVLPEWRVAAVEDVRFLAACKFYKGAPRTLTLRATFRHERDAIVAACSLNGRRRVAGQAEDVETTYFTARVRMRRELKPAERLQAPRVGTAERVEAPDIYRIYFHGPAYRVLDHAWRVDGMVVGRMAGKLPANHVPRERPTVMAPRLIELAFQTAGIWDLGVNGRLSLPQAIDSVTSYVGSETPGQAAVAVVRPSSRGRVFDADVVDESGRVAVSIRGYHVVELPGAADETLLGPLRRAMSAVGSRASLAVANTVTAG
jgi:hypothetical protein